MKKHIYITVLIIAIVPSIAFAAWWNPASWFGNWSFSNKVDPKTEALEKRIRELEGKLASTTIPVAQISKISSEVSSPTTNTPVSKKVTGTHYVPKVTSPIQTEIGAQIEIQVKAALKEKMDQEALFAKQKLDEQAMIDSAKAKAYLEAQNELNLDAQQQAIQLQEAQNAALIKQNKLEVINQQIATLNEKYAADVKAARSGPATLEQSDAFVRDINRRYTADYDALHAQWQKVFYGN